MKRPLIFILFFFIMGILLAQVNSIIIKILLLILLYFLSFLLSKIYKIKALNFIIFVSIFSLILTIFSISPKSKALEDAYLNNEFLKITGTITNINSSGETVKSIILKTNSVEVNDQVIDEKVNILVYVNSYESFYLGQEVFFTGYLNKASKPSNPTSYNEQRSFYIKNIQYKVYPTYYEITGINNNFLYNLSKIKKEIKEIYYKILPYSEASILNGIILGDRSYIEQEILSVYKNAGIYHILAISGLHITILSLFLTKIFDCLHPKYGKMLVILILVFYCIFTGSSLSTIRATIMSSISLIGFIFYKRYDFISATCLSMLILLCINPIYLFDIGFIYSFTSVFSIAFLGLKIIQIKKIPEFLYPLIISFFVGLAIKPITMYNFYTINLIDIFLNILVLPLMSIVVSVGFLAILIAIFNIKLSAFIIGFAYYILRFFTYICTVIDRMDFININTGRPSIVTLIIYYLLIFLIGFCVYDKHLLKKRIKYINIGIFVFLLVYLTLNLIPKPFEITMLRTSKGEVFIGEYNNFNFLIDGGDKYSDSSSSVAESIILPYLNQKDINKLDAIFVTNCDDNYITGIIEILDLIDVEKIFVPYSSFTNENYIKLFTKASEKDINVYKLKSGDKINIGNLNFEVLYPYEDDLYTYENNLIFKINFLEKSILFTSSKEDLYNIQNIQINSDILKISDESFFANYEYLKSLNLSCIITSLNLSDLDYNDYDLQIFSTYTDGAINIKFYNNGKILYKTYK